MQAGTEVVRIAGEGRRNALTSSAKQQLGRDLRLANDNDACRFIVLTGTAESFCAGGDLRATSLTDPDQARASLEAGQELVRTIANSSKPVIAAVEGAAAGSGLSLAVVCDVIVASRTAIFAAPFGQVGLAPDAGLAWSLPRRIGYGRALMMMLSGDSVKAEDPEAHQLVDVLVEPGEVLDAAIALAADLSRAAPLSTSATKRLVLAAQHGMDALFSHEFVEQLALLSTNDFAEGRRAFLERRPPRFIGS